MADSKISGLPVAILEGTDLFHVSKSGAGSKQTDLVSIKEYLDDNSTKIERVLSTDNAIVKFNGTNGEVQDSNVIITGDGKIVTTNIHSIVDLTLGTDDGAVSGGVYNGGSTSNSVIIAADPDNAGGGSRLQFDVDGNEAMRINESGYIGIGTASPKVKLDVNGGIATAITTKTSNYTATVDDSTLLCDTSTGFTVTLPDATTCEGFTLNIKKISTDGNTLVISSSDLIDGETTQDITTAWTTMSVQSNGVSWYII